MAKKEEETPKGGGVLANPALDVLKSEKFASDFRNLSMELGSDWAKSRSKRYKEMSEMAGLDAPDEYLEPPNHMDDDITSVYLNDKNNPKDK
jgi:hypothetical protein